MTETTPNRRDVLKAVGAAGSFGVVGIANTAAGELGSVRFVEAGLTHDLPDGYPYYGVGLDSLKAYRIDLAEGQLTFRKEGPEAARRLFATRDAVVAGGKLRAAPALATATGPTTLLTTSLASGYRPAGAVHLTESRQPPAVSVRVVDGDVTVTVDGVTDTLPTGREYERELDARPVTAQTAEVLDELVDNPEVPKAQRSQKVEYGTVTVDATPTVKARDYGTLTVVEPDQ